MQYKIQNDPITNKPCSITIVGQNISIPFDPANSDYQAYLKFLEDGGIPEPADQ